MQNSVIFSRVRIGDSDIAGANSIVGSNVEPYTVVVGNPARAIRQRFDDEMIQILEHLRWWDRPIEEINAMIPLLTNPDIDFVKRELSRRLEV